MATLHRLWFMGIIAFTADHGKLEPFDQDSTFYWCESGSEYYPVNKAYQIKFVPFYLVSQSFKFFLKWASFISGSGNGEHANTLDQDPQYCWTAHISQQTFPLHLWCNTYASSHEPWSFDTFTLLAATILVSIWQKLWWLIDSAPDWWGFESGIFCNDQLIVMRCRIIV